MFLALAEVRRSLGRFALLTCSVALLVVLLLFFQTVGGALTGALNGSFEQAQADVWVYDDTARRNPLTSVLGPDALDGVTGVEGVAEASAVTILVLDVDDDPSTIIATDPGSPAMPGDVDGSEPAAAGEALLGTSGFVGDLPGDEVVLPGDVALEVVGESEGATFNVLPTIYAPREDVADALAARAGGPMGDGSTAGDDGTTDQGGTDGAPVGGGAAGRLPASALAVAVDDGTDPSEVAAAVTEQVDGVEAVTADEAIASLPGASTITQSFTFLYVLLYLVVAIVTAVFFRILTVQKLDSLVLLRAVGGRARDLVVPVLVQVVVVVGGAALVGAGVAAGLLAAGRAVFGTGLDPVTVVTSAALLLAIGLVAGLASTRQALSAEPVQAVRGSEL